MAAAERDYYEVLGVPRHADEDAIRRAFYGLARASHPDVAESPDAEQRFRQLAEAYSVLSKREARLLYDRYGYRGRGNQLHADAARGDNVHVDIDLKCFEAAGGTRRIVSYEAVGRCTDCRGHGSVGRPEPDCECCLGTGRKRTVSEVDTATVIQIEPCPACVGEPCSGCGGTGTVPVERRLRVIVPPGLEDGAQLRVSGDGNDGGAGSIPGDLLLRVHVVPPPKDPPAVRYGSLALLLVAIATLVLYVVL